METARICNIYLFTFKPYLIVLPVIKFILFDCFNTLIDDFDEEGDSTGIKPLSRMAYDAGYYHAPDAFYADYIYWRQKYWSEGNDEEVALEKRLEAVLNMKNKEQIPSNLVGEMIHAFHKTYPKSLRVTPGIEGLLSSINGKVRLGVVSNFFLEDLPRRYLRHFGLDHFFEFVIDSARLGIKKPGKQIYLEALSRFGITELDTNEVVFVGDNLVNDVLAPRKIGINSFHFDRHRSRKGLVPSPDNNAFTEWEQFYSRVF